MSFIVLLARTPGLRNTQTGFTLAAGLPFLPGLTELGFKPMDIRMVLGYSASATRRGRGNGVRATGNASGAHAHSYMTVVENIIEKWPVVSSSPWSPSSSNSTEE